MLSLTPAFAPSAEHDSKGAKYWAANFTMVLGNGDTLLELATYLESNTEIGSGAVLEEKEFGRVRTKKEAKGIDTDLFDGYSVAMTQAVGHSRSSWQLACFCPKCSTTHQHGFL